MLVRVRMAGVARCAAMLVAGMVSGAPRLLALEAPVEVHRCCCKASAGVHHDCECAICRRAALAAQANDPRAPPCHRAAARKELSRNEPVGSRGAPCVEGRCGAPDRPLITPAGLEPFFPPATALGIARGQDESPLALVQAHLQRAVTPETPPPRAS
jgi:hypothetical protein